VRFAVLCVVVSACAAGPTTRPLSSYVPTTAPEPVRRRVVVTETSIELLDKIGFFGGSATLRPESTHQLDALAQTLEHTDFASLEVQAYAGDVPQVYQQMLSEQRARRLVDYLVKHGVKRNRLIAIGGGAPQNHGDNRPSFFISWR
jgi:outer membrane protein OmpA-like peptidoglycan-associated protein